MRKQLIPGLPSSRRRPGVEANAKCTRPFPAGVRGWLARLLIDYFCDASPLLPAPLGSAVLIRLAANCCASVDLCDVEITSIDSHC